MSNKSLLLLEETLTVHNLRGIHGRIATKLAKIARQPNVRLFLVTQENETIDCLSILDILSMAFVHGSEVRVRAEGKGAVESMAAVRKLFNRNNEL